ncbi:MAG: molybdopterin molybdotransferase MoeA [Neisseria sp.]|nr:molybdopterin molybdotransferase MoeA [Neisseria sp.]
MISLADLNRLIADTLRAAPFTLSVEQLPLHAALGRVLAAEVRAVVALPANNVSAMDGYALPLTGSLNAGERLRLVGEVAAGNLFSGSVAAGECVRIMTGAPVPPDCNTVIMQENVQRDGDAVTLTAAARSGSHVRYAGEEVACGDLLLSAGKVLSAADIMLLASQGIGSVDVFRKPRVAIFSSGDELLEAGQAVTNASQIYDCNRPMLRAKLAAFPVEIMDLGIIPDCPATTLNILREAGETADIVMSSGGVSVGDYDFLKEALQQLGTVHQHKVAMKPGKPFLFGQLGQAFYFGLPGNPVAGFVGFDMIVKAALWQLCGAAPRPRLQFQAALDEEISRHGTRLEVRRAVLEQDEDGALCITSSGKQDSHRILGTARANAYYIVPSESAQLFAGEKVTVIPFAETFL